MNYNGVDYDAVESCLIHFIYYGRQRTFDAVMISTAPPTRRPFWKGPPFTHANRRPPMGGRGRCLTIKPSYAVIRRADADTEAEAARAARLPWLPLRWGGGRVVGGGKRASKSGNNI